MSDACAHSAAFQKLFDTVARGVACSFEEVMFLGFASAAALIADSSGGPIGGDAANGFVMLLLVL